MAVCYPKGVKVLIVCQFFFSSYVFADSFFSGKGNEDKRGQSIALSVAEKSWLYLNGQPVICDRATEIAAMVSAANPSINLTMDSIEMGALQQVRNIL